MAACSRSDARTAASRCGGGRLETFAAGFPLSGLDAAVDSHFWESKTWSMRCASTSAASLLASRPERHARAASAYRLLSVGLAPVEPTGGGLCTPAERLRSSRGSRRRGRRSISRLPATR
eukprot:scaffold282930_cov30-Tisochrysis_lutea.AAC.1